MDNLAVIDVGTNTFHLLIVKILPDKRFEEQYRERVFVNLAEEGIQAIGKAAYKRAFDTLVSFYKKTTDEGVQNIKAIGTEALRISSNGTQLVDDIYSSTGIEIEIISGEREAELIFQGIKLAIPDFHLPYLIMDIGGGSVEYILVQDGKPIWAQSFKLGVAVLYHGFHKSDPISAEDLIALNLFLKKSLDTLAQKLKDLKLGALVGASGSFEVLEQLVKCERKSKNHCIVKTDEFYPHYTKITHSSYQERKEMEDIPKERAKLIVVAFELIRYTLELFTPGHIIISDYAMKEGMLKEYLD